MHDGRFPIAAPISERDDSIRNMGQLINVWSSGRKPDSSAKCNIRRSVRISPLIVVTKFLQGERASN
jgi:hypothetical protein